MVSALSTETIDAAEFAARKVSAVRDDPVARLALVHSTYEDAIPARRLPYRRAAISFMQWEVRRGVLARDRRLGRVRPEAERASLVSGPPMAASSLPTSTTAIWPRLRPGGSGSSSTWSCCGCCTRTRWSPRRAAPRLAIGKLAPLGRLLGDPRLGMAGIFLSLRRVVPNRYPLADEVERYVGEENGLGRTLDYTVIRPRPQRLYEWSAAELEEPRAATLISAGTPSSRCPR